MSVFDGRPMAELFAALKPERLRAPVFYSLRVEGCLGESTLAQES